MPPLSPQMKPWTINRLVLTVGPSKTSTLSSDSLSILASACDFNMLMWWTSSSWIWWERRVRMRNTGGFKWACYHVLCISTVPQVWLVIFARDLFSHFSEVKSHLRKLKPRNFMLSTCKASELHFNPAYFKLSSHPNSLSASEPLTAIAQAIQEIEVLLKHRRTNWTVVEGRERKQSFLQMSWVWGYLLPTLEQRAVIAISLCRQF